MRRVVGFLACAALVASCGGGGKGDSGGSGSGSGGSSFGGDPDVVPDPNASPDAPPAMVDPNPTSPNDDGGGSLAWTDAPEMMGVTVEANADSAIVYAPIVDGAKDYRVVLLPSGTSVNADGDGESVAGTTIFCAGYRQHSAPVGPRELLRRVEVVGLTGPTRMAIEAIDAPCPFPGIRGNEHHDFAPPMQDVSPADAVPFSIYTDDEIKAKYGSVIVNGHGKGAQLAAQADPISPKVLARTAVVVTPKGNAKPDGFTFYDDFSDDEDQPKFVKNVSDGGRSQFPKLYQNSKWSFYTYDAGDSQMYIERGLLRMVLNDWSEDVMSSNFAVPKQPAQLSDSDYLHITFEVQNDGTARRYWWLFLCGADQAGKTFDSSGNFLGNIIQTPFFFDPDGLNPSLEGWNCLQAFSREGWAFPLPPDDKNPETDVRIMVNKAGDLMRDNVVNTSPPMYPAAVGSPSWYRQADAKGNPTQPILDDQQLVSPRTRFDFYVRRDRVIMLINGQQRLCNDFPAQKLTMAEAAVGFGQVFYHSSGEHIELPQSDWDRSGKRYILEVSPFLDVRTYDNTGFAEHAQAPQGFDASVCYPYSP